MAASANFIEAAKWHRKDPSNENRIGKMSEAFCKFVTSNQSHHFFHNYPGYDEVLAIFSLTAEIPIVQKSKDILAAQIGSCDRCAEMYQHCLVNYKSKAVKQYGSEVTRQLYKIITAWDTGRIIESIRNLLKQNSNESNVEELNRLATPVLTELLCNPDYLQMNSLNSLLEQLIPSLSHLPGETLRSKNLASTILLMVNPNESVRKFGFRLFATTESSLVLNNSQKSQFEQVLESLFEILNHKKKPTFNVVAGEFELLRCLYNMLTRHCELW